MERTDQQKTARQEGQRMNSHQVVVEHPQAGCKPEILSLKAPLDCLSPFQAYDSNERIFATWYRKRNKYWSVRTSIAFYFNNFVNKLQLCPLWKTETVVFVFIESLAVDIDPSRTLSCLSTSLDWHPVKTTPTHAIVIRWLDTRSLSRVLFAPGGTFTCPFILAFARSISQTRV